MTILLTHSRELKEVIIKKHMKKFHKGGRSTRFHTSFHRKQEESSKKSVKIRFHKTLGVGIIALWNFSRGVDLIFISTKAWPGLACHQQYSQCSVDCLDDENTCGKRNFCGEFRLWAVVMGQIGSDGHLVRQSSRAHAMLKIYILL